MNIINLSSPKEIDRLEQGFTGNDNYMSDGLNYPANEFNIVNYNRLDSVGSGVFDPNHIRAYRKDGMIRVIQVEWKSMRKVGIITYQDDFGTEQEDISR